MRRLPADQFDFASTGKAPFKDFVSILSELQEAGLVRAVDNGLMSYRTWAETRSGDEAIRLEEIKKRQNSLKNIEREHGSGAVLDLNHPLVLRLIEWRKLDDVRYRNAVTYRDLKTSLHH